MRLLEKISLLICTHISLRIIDEQKVFLDGNSIMAIRVLTFNVITVNILFIDELNSVTQIKGPLSNGGMKI